MQYIIFDKIKPKMENDNKQSRKENALYGAYIGCSITLVDQLCGLIKLGIEDQVKRPPAGTKCYRSLLRPFGLAMVIPPITGAAIGYLMPPRSKCPVSHVECDQSEHRGVVHKKYLSISSSALD